MEKKDPWFLFGVIASLLLAGAVLLVRVLRSRWISVTPDFFTASIGGWVAVAVIVAMVLPMVLLALVAAPLERPNTSSSFDSACSGLLSTAFLVYLPLSWCLVFGANTCFDNSPEQQITARVSRIYVTTGKSRITWWELEGDFGTGRTLTVQRMTSLGVVAVGTRMHVRFHRGLFGVPWGYLRRVD